MRLNADLVKKSGYLSGYLSLIYLFSCMLYKECLYLWTSLKKRVMKKHYLIIGKPDSSVAHLTELITGDRKYKWLLDGDSPKDNRLYTVDEDTEVIIVDAVYKKNIAFWMSCADFGVTIEKQGRDPFTIKPILILIPEKKIEITKSIKRRFYVYKSK